MPGFLLFQYLPVPGKETVPLHGRSLTGCFNKNNLMKAYFILLLAIVLETIATSFLKQSEQFTKLLPSIVTIAGYAGSFYCLSIVLKNIPVGIAYAIWSGMGIVLISAIGWAVFKQHLDLPAILAWRSSSPGFWSSMSFPAPSPIDGKKEETRFCRRKKLLLSGGVHAPR